MALALILRNSTRLQGSLVSQNFLKCAYIAAVPKTYSQSSIKSQQLIANKHLWNLNTTLSKNKNVLSQVRPMSGHGDHSKLWPIEKGISVGLLLLAPLTFAYPNFLFDNLFAVASVIHFHWGLEACIVDYVRPIIVGNTIPKLTILWLYLISATTLGFLIYYNVSDIGIGKTVRKFWAIKN